MARDSAVPRSDVPDKTELLIVLPTGLVAQGQNRLFLAGFDFARCLFWFQPNDCKSSRPERIHSSLLFCNHKGTKSQTCLNEKKEKVA